MAFSHLHETVLMRDASDTSQRPRSIWRTLITGLYVSWLLGVLAGWDARFLSQAVAQDPKALVAIQSGDLPIILTAPHGGNAPIPGVPPRQGKDIARFRTATDALTKELTENLADAIEGQMGKRPFVVAACFHRKYLDANRRPSEAFESIEAESAYRDYHQAITDARNEVIQRWGHGILLDIHGQIAEPTTIFRGTQNGKSTTHLIQRFGVQAQNGPLSLWGLFAKHGFQVMPEVGSVDREHADYNGGYTVITHGSGSGGTIDAVQLEIGRDLRAVANQMETTNQLAMAIREFAEMYLPRSEGEFPLEVQQTKPTIPGKESNLRIGVYVDEGAGPQQLLSVLQADEGISIVRLRAEDIRSGKLEGLDLVIHPGGSGGGQGRHLGEDGREAIREFVRSGGGFIGICAGAYLATADYSWSLHILDAKVIDRQHWNRGKGTVEISLSDEGRRLFGVEQEQVAIHYAQGPLLAPGDRPEIEDFESLATYETEIVKNGASPGVMKGTTAIACGKFGNGRVLCFSPHPEKTQGLEAMLRVAIDGVKRIRE